MKEFLKPDLTTYPLARRMMWIIILGSLLFTVLISTAQALIEYQQEMSRLNTRLQQIRDIEVPSLTNSVWHFDQDQINTQLQGILNFEDIVYAEVNIVDGKIYHAGQNISASDGIVQNYSLVYVQGGQNYVVGQLQVTADRRLLQQRLSGWIISNLLASAIQIFLLAGFILLVVNLILTRPLNEIVRYTEALDLDHLDIPLVLQPRKLAASNDELDRVALKLNEMRRRLIDDIGERQQMGDALRLSERNYREIFNATSEAIFIHDILSGRIIQVNASMLRMYGFANEAEANEKTIGDLSSNISPFNQIEAEKYLQKALLEGPQVFEWLARRKDDSVFWSEVSLHSTSIGGENRILAVVRDITERKQVENLLRAQNETLIAQGRALEKAEAQTRQLNIELEQRVKERTQQLMILNQELESFSYSAAHDLRAPLRHMNAYSKIILEDYGAELNDEVKKSLERIQETSKNLAEMVDSLLALTRVTRDDLHLDQVNLSNLAQEIADDLHHREPGRMVEFVIAPDLVVQADKKLLRVMLENLLGNAWKFTAKKFPARIELGHIPSDTGSSENGNGVIYFIRDNGAGFDMTYADRLFTPFQRLHSAVTFSGTGIGLATVKRIVQRHSGRVWAEGTENLGATFYFTLS